MATKHQVSVFDIRWTAESEDAEPPDFSAWCKHWCVQLEKSDTGYLHFQGRISLIKKRRQQEIKPLLDAAWGVKLWMAPTSNGAFGEWFYVMKADTRVAGPWTDKDEKPPYIPQDLRDITLRPWQQTIVNSKDDPINRHINVVYDPQGGNGKSIIRRYIGSHRIGQIIPPLENYKELMGIIMCKPKRSLYIVDMPRGLEKRKLTEFWSAMESLKDGHAFDTRYSFKEEYFDPPALWVFTNSVPKIELLSIDRWKFWMFRGDELVRANIDEVKHIAFNKK